MVIHVSHISPLAHVKNVTLEVFSISSEYIRIMVRTVVVLAVTYFCTMPVSEIWIAFDTGMYFRFIGIQGIAKALGTERASVLPLFTAFTECDTVSAFHGKGKKSAWDTWMAYVKLTDVFAFLMWLCCCLTPTKNNCDHIGTVS